MAKITVQSLIVALVIGLIAPFVWIVATGETRATPVIEKSFSDNMSEAQRQEWIAKNAKPTSFWGHVKSSIWYTTEAWKGYLEAAAVVFIFVFIANFAFLSYKEKP